MAKEKTVLITGVSRGIGLATAQRLSSAGYRVIGWSRSEPGSEFPGQWTKCDLSDRAAVDAALNKVLAEHQIDCLVNNAAWPFADKIGELDLDKLVSSLDFHVRSTVQTMQAVIPGMKQRGWGRIVNLLTTILSGATGRSIYRAAKAGVWSITVSAALELADTGITVNGVAPGPTATNAFYSQNPPGSSGEKYFIDQVPMSRLGKPDEIAAAIEFFLSEPASFITGQLLFADGGMSVGRKLGS